ncbi:hypothetical protein FV141_14415 (plasmid) [Dermacoccus abyssi]|uniref:Uncharacterized protein n=1 Tax=Dermacoccus abyssi TaxID=322596 RepID=A0ABX5ZD61_9MICO|nr:hypothetical protein FV141_14415 [Dermacoccus abyssi]
MEDIADPRPSLAMHDGLVITLTQPAGTGILTLTAVHAETGERAWSSPLPQGTTVTAGPSLITLEGAARVVVATQDAVLAWDAVTGKQHVKVAVPSDAASVTTSAFGVWSNHSGQRRRALIGGTFQPFTLPKGTSPLGVLERQLVVADTKGQVWKLSAGKAAGKPTKLQGPKDGHPEPSSWRRTLYS